MHSPKEGNKKFWKNILEASIAPLNIVVAICIGFGIGYIIDRLLNTSPYLTLIFLILGIIAGFRELFRSVKRLSNGNDK